MTTIELIITIIFGAMTAVSYIVLKITNTIW